MNSANIRFILAALLIFSAAMVLQARQRNEVFASRLPLQDFPRRINAWSGTDIAIDNDTLQILGAGEFLLRTYRSEETSDPDINLFIAYFPSQRAGDTIHSPRHCLPGAGWTPVENTRTVLSMPGHAPFPANRYVIAQGASRQIVLYWYWAHDRGIASEYWAKFYLVGDSLKMNRSDGALVRVMAAMYPNETADAAEQRLLPFTNGILPLLNDYIPR
jgi:EpsI family protein